MITSELIKRNPLVSNDFNFDDCENEIKTWLDSNGLADCQVWTVETPNDTIFLIADRERHFNNRRDRMALIYIDDDGNAIEMPDHFVTMCEIFDLIIEEFQTEKNRLAIKITNSTATGEDYQNFRDDLSSGNFGKVSYSSDQVDSYLCLNKWRDWVIEYDGDYTYDSLVMAFDRFIAKNSITFLSDLRSIFKECEDYRNTDFNYDEEDDDLEIPSDDFGTEED